MLVSRGADVNAKDEDVSLGMGGCKGFLCFLQGLFISSCLVVVFVLFIGQGYWLQGYLLLLFVVVIC